MKSYISRKLPLETRTTARNFDAVIWRTFSFGSSGCGILPVPLEAKAMKMKIRSRVPRTAVFAVLALLSSAAAFADEVKVMTSGAFTAAYLQLVPEFEH